MTKSFLYSLVVIAFCYLLLQSCKKDENNGTDNGTNNNDSTTTVTDTLAPYLKFIEASTQRSGNAAAGYEYLVYGNYVSSGFPYSVFETLGPAFNNDNLLGRTGDNEIVPYNFTAVEAPNGIKVVGPNCLQCHAQKINGELIVGLGNAIDDYTSNQNSIIAAADFFVDQGTPEWDAYEAFRRGTLIIGPQIVTEVRGVNPADKLFAILSSHRDKDHLTWHEEEEINIPDEVVVTDIPAWWHLKKRNSMFYTALGRGDFARIMMASNLLTMTDSSEARVVDNRFADVQAFLNSIEPPAYPQAINESLALEGAQIFAQNCASCHGTYGDTDTYPNLLVSLDFLQTDPMLAQTYSAEQDYLNWYNTGWFSKAPNAARFALELGYIAPPLDGLWATAPYLHNGSVPNIETLLKSDVRPTYWSRSFETNYEDYDFNNLGWKYTVEASGAGTKVYDTTIEGYTNTGHTFGDHLTTPERNALIEYLKTL